MKTATVDTSAVIPITDSTAQLPEWTTMHRDAHRCCLGNRIKQYCIQGLFINVLIPTNRSVTVAEPRSIVESWRDVDEFSRQSGKKTRFRRPSDVRFPPLPSG
ncbi:hypothetical protein GWI33_015016 [Rhynchophorus ferrugineus]|uniref:Uncharacterized protein n=1 Tax=Rhynchophorus ferrugineus TaxID=354439 RepID=A0A834I688_RHYFE|nr:hypothetical protein GWI33_015016 [Rhynchophorus ferrugineus]